MVRLELIIYKGLSVDLSYFFPYSSLTAGDTWNWSLDLANYAASAGWHLSYTAKKEGQATKTFITAAEGNNHVFYADSTLTAAFIEGKYVWSVSLISVSLEKLTLGTKIITINPDLSLVSDSYDPRSHNQKCLEALEAVLYKNADRDVLETVFKDYTVKYRSNMELLRLFNYYKLQVDAENGIKSGRIIINRV